MSARTRATGPDARGKLQVRFGFTGKEDDLEAGIQYFGKRLFLPALGRWLTPDPLAVHAPGKADLNLYAYVHGQLLRATDPTGLEGTERKQGELSNADKAKVDIGVGAAKAAGEIVVAASIAFSCSVYESAACAEHYGNAKPHIPFFSNAQTVGEGVAEAVLLGPSGDVSEESYRQWRRDTAGKIARGLFGLGMELEVARQLGGPRGPAEGPGVAPPEPSKPTGVTPSVAGPGFPPPGQAAPVGPASPAVPRPGPGAPRAGAPSGGYKIIDGTHRARAALKLGMSEIQAELYQADKLVGPMSVDVASLRTPKSVLDLSGKGMMRWNRALEEMSSGSSAPIKIEVGEGGTPIVKLRLINGQF